MRQKSVAWVLVLSLLIGVSPTLLAAESTGEDVPRQTVCTQEKNCPAEEHDLECPEYRESEKEADNPGEESFEDAQGVQGTDSGDDAVFHQGVQSTRTAKAEIDYQKLYSTSAATGGVAVTGFNMSYVETIPAEEDGLKRISLIIPRQINGKDVVEISTKAFFESVQNGVSTIDPVIRVTELDLSQATELRTIGDYAFYRFGSNTYQELAGTLTIPEKVTSIGNNAFSGLSGLTGDLLLPDSIEDIKDSAFKDCGFDGKVKLPQNEKYTVVKKQILFGTNITELTGGIPANITTLQDSAFRDTKLAGDIVIPDTVTTLGSSFEGTAITSLVIPSSVQTITSKYWIAECSQLKFVKFDAVDTLDTPSVAFPMAQTGAGYHADLTILFPTKEAYERAAELTKKERPNHVNYFTYETTVVFDTLTEHGTRNVLYNRPLNWKQDTDGWMWSEEQGFALPPIPNMQEGKDYGWSFRQQGATINDIITESSRVTGERLYPVTYFKQPIVSTSGDLSKTYDGNPITWTLTVSHPYLESSYYRILCNWQKVELENYRYKSQVAINGSSGLNSYGSKTSCAFQTVEDSTFCINEGTRSFYQVKWYMFHWNGSKWEAMSDQGFSGTIEFQVTINKGVPSVQPSYPAEAELETAWRDIPISVQQSSPEGTIAWKDDTGTVVPGVNQREWVFTPTDSENYEEVTGTAKIFGGPACYVTAVESGPGGTVTPEMQMVVPDGDATVQITRTPGYQVAQVLVDGADRTSDLQGNVLTVHHVTQDTAIIVTFEKMKADDFEPTIPQVKPDEPLDEETKESILDTKLNYEALEDEKEKVSEEGRDQLNEALAALPAVEVKVAPKGDLAPDKVPVTDDLPTLLENMTKQEAEGLKAGTITDYQVIVEVEAATPEKELQESIAAALGDGTSADYFDVKVKKVVKTGTASEEKTLTELARPITLMFAIPKEIQTAPSGMKREFTMLRTHQTEAGIVTEKLKNLGNDPKTYTVQSDRFSIYTLTYQDTQVSAGHSSGGMSSSGIAAEKTSHGSVTMDRTRAAKGVLVSVTVKPDTGYRLDHLAITGKSGKEVQWVKKGENQYTFTMPGEAVTVAASFVPADASSDAMPFRDVPDDAWYADAVRYGYQKGLMQGTAADRFSPQRITTRGMIVTILYRAEGAPSVGKRGAFPDVSADQYDADAIAWAVEQGLVTGYDNGQFGSNDPVTREQLATILYRYAGWKNWDRSAHADLSGFADAGAISGYAVDALQWAYGEGLISGTSETVLAPGAYATRAQVATILMRLDQHIWEKTDRL